MSLTNSRLNQLLKTQNIARLISSRINQVQKKNLEQEKLDQITTISSLEKIIFGKPIDSEIAHIESKNAILNLVMEIHIKELNHMKEFLCRSYLRS